jgi:TMEM175 potassium channel family protein
MDDESRVQRFERANDPTRVLALSDGVFAIILTLLVLEIHVPELAGGQTLADAGREIRPSFTAFIISFVVVAIAWMGHRDLFSLIRRTDRTLIWLNFLYMLPLSILPFGAALIARYDRDPVALRMFGLLLVAIAATRLVMWLYATNRPYLLFAPLEEWTRRTGTVLVIIPGLVYAIGVLIADTAPTASLTIYALVPVIYFIAITLVRSSAPTESEKQEFT